MSDRFSVAVLVETAKVYGRGLLEGVARFVRAQRSWSIYIDERSLDDPTPDWLDHRPCDGILLRTRSRSIVQSVQGMQVPVVYLGEFYDTDLPFVISDDDLLARCAADELLNRGFRRFGYVGVDGSPWADARRDALSKILSRQGCQLAVLQPVDSSGGLPSWPEHQNQLSRWLRNLAKPVGIVACYDVLGVRVLDACREIGIAVPEEVAVVGFDNDSVLCELSTPPLTSVAHDVPEIGYRASCLLDALMRGDQPHADVIRVKPRGVVSRQSSDVLAIEDRDIAAALHFIREHACEGIKVQDVLRQVPLTSVTLKRRFEKLLGRSAKDEIIRIRLERIKQLLNETDFTLDAIAQLAGFKHVEYMSAMFKDRIGMTPGQYRESSRFE